MSSNKNLEKSILYLHLDEKINKILIDNNIKLIKDIWTLKRKTLKELGFTDTQINAIIIKLQLNGLDLNKKVYNNM